MGGGGGKANSAASTATGNELEMFTKLADLAVKQQGQREQAARAAALGEKPNPLFSEPLKTPSAGAAGTATFGGGAPVSMGAGFPPIPSWYGPGPSPVPAPAGK